jgi:hypothetical protein
MINNIKDFLDYRNNSCFFCKQELTIFPRILSGADFKYELDGPIFTISSKYINLSINIIENTVQVPDKIGYEMHLFLSRQSLIINKSCANCDKFRPIYEVVGSFEFNPLQLRVKPIASMTEYIIVNYDFSLDINHIEEKSLLTLHNKNSGLSSVKPSSWFELPFINIEGLTFEQLKHKLNIYKVFI